jgi:hypothetical protein
VATETIEARVLREMRLILTEIARETAVHKGTRHVLSSETIVRMRDCLSLISARERELNEARGIEMTSRPKLGGEKTDSVRVQFRKPKPGIKH